MTPSYFPNFTLVTAFFSQDSHTHPKKKETKKTYRDTTKEYQLQIRSKK